MAIYVHLCRKSCKRLIVKNYRKTPITQLAHSLKKHKKRINNLLGLVNIWQFGSLTLLADDWNTIGISLSDLVSLSLSLLYM